MRMRPFAKRIIALSLCAGLVLSGTGGTTASQVNIDETQTEGVAIDSEVSSEEAVPAAVSELTEDDAQDAEKEQTLDADPGTDANADEADARGSLANQEGLTEGETETEESTELEEEPEARLIYDDGTVLVKVSAEDGVIPEGTKLCVTPIEKNETETTASQSDSDAENSKTYEEVAAELEKDAEENDYELLGFLAYDISFEKDGVEIEPDGDVTVTMEYVNPVLPEGIEDATDANVTVMHLEENKKGEVENVVDLTAAGATVETDEQQAVSSAVFTSDSFSTFTFIWNYKNADANSPTINLMHVVDNGDGTVSVLDYDTGSTSITLKTSPTENITTTIGTKTFTETAGPKEVFSDYVEKNIEVNGVKYKWTGTVKYIDITTEEIDGSHVHTADVSSFRWVLDTQRGSKTQSNGTPAARIYEESGNGYHTLSDGNLYTLQCVYEKVTDPDSNIEEESKLGEPEHKKYVTYNEADDDYTLTLDVTGNTGTSTGVDVLLLVDNSANMKTYATITDLRTALSTTIGNILPNEQTPNKMALVTFDRTATTNVDWTSGTDKGTLTNAVEKLTYNNSTVYSNWQAGFAQAESLLGNVASDGNSKIIIFISTGMAKSYLKNGTATTITDTSVTNKGMTYALSEIMGSKYLKCARFYSVYTSDQSKTNVGVFTDYLTTGGIDAYPADGTSATALKKILTEIAKQVTTPEYKNIVITDTLSDYVEFAEKDPTFTVTATTVSDDGTTTTTKIESNEYTVETSGEDNKTITFTLYPDGKALAKGTTYSISFKIKTTAAAMNEYIKSGYPEGVTGGTHTGNKSEGADGFYSNTSATLTYTETGLEKTSVVNYYKPVVQINTAALATKNVTFTKVWDDFDNAYNTRPDSLKVTLIGQIEDDTTKELTPVKSYEAEVEAEKDWTYTWQDVPVYYVSTSGSVQKIEWTVQEAYTGTYEYTWDQMVYTDSTKAAAALVNKSTLNHVLFSSDTVNSSQIPSNSTSATKSSSRKATARIQTSEEDETSALSAADVSTLSLEENTVATYAMNSSSGTFNHIDIEASGSYTFTSGGTKYTLEFDFYNGTWMLTNEAGTETKTGTIDVSTLQIKQIPEGATTGNDISVSGSWQSSTLSGQSKEYRISGTFSRTDTINIHFEIPVELNGVIINLVADFNTKYSDTTYNVCPGNGNSRGVDVQIEKALSTVLAKGVLAITKEFKEIDPADAGTITFTIAKDGEPVEEVSYSEFTQGSYIYFRKEYDDGAYTVTETCVLPDGYTSVTTTYSVNGSAETEGSIADAKINSGEITTVNFTNTYVEKPATHDLVFRKVWVGGSVQSNDVLLDVVLVDSNTKEKTAKEITLTKDHNWQATLTEQPETLTIESVTEKEAPNNYKDETTISTDGTLAIVTNTYENLTEGDYTVTKVWSGDAGYESKRQPVKVALYQTNNTTNITTKVQEITLSGDDNNWTFTFTDLKFREEVGTVTTTYTYFVKELTNVSGYKSVVSSGTSAAIITNTLDEDLLDESLYIVNKLTTEEITVNKYWDDENNKYGSRPATLDITLTNDGATVKTFTLGAGEDNTANKWSATVTVPKPVEESSYNAAEGENGDGVENYEQEYYKSNTDADGNCVIDIVNKPDKINIVIEKIWQDAGNAYRTRPTSITFNLYQGENKEPVETETFKAEDCADPYDTSYWYCTFEDLDPGYEYSIEEVVVSGYTTTYSNESMTVTNTLNWQIIKQSTSEDSTTGNHPKLAGAEFTLKGETKIYYGLSNAEGVIQWYASAQDIKPVESFEDGTYTLTETKAPAGYSVSTEEWKLEMKGNVPTITVEGETKSCNTSTNGVVTFLYEDEVLYSLPEAGGEGIFLFVIAGMLLMMGGALLIFAQRRRVLRI